MKKHVLVAMALAMTLGMSAQNKNGDQQGNEKFSPEKFDAALQAFITSEAHLSAQEAAKFFPVYKEMQQKQRAVFDRQRRLVKQKPDDEESCKKAITEHDEKDIELKRIQQCYHKRFMELLPASKVYDILKAEECFHRRAMRNWGRRDNHEGQKPPRPYSPGKRPQK